MKKILNVLILSLAIVCFTANAHHAASDIVDDETYVLDGLKRMLRSMRKDWDMQFLESGREALDYLDKQEVDVVVS